MTKPMTDTQARKAALRLKKLTEQVNDIACDIEQRHPKGATIYANLAENGLTSAADAKTIIFRILDGES